jgi:hypothetical protein
VNIPFWEKQYLQWNVTHWALNTRTTGWTSGTRFERIVILNEVVPSHYKGIKQTVAASHQAFTYSSSITPSVLQVHSRSNILSWKNVHKQCGNRYHQQNCISSFLCPGTRCESVRSEVQFALFAICTLIPLRHWTLRFAYFWGVSLNERRESDTHNRLYHCFPKNTIS